MTRVAFIGLGNTSTPMVQHLIAAGCLVCACVRRPEAVNNVRTLNAELCSAPAEAVHDVEVIFADVTSMADVESVPLGPNGIIHGAPHGAVHTDHSTISTVATRRVAADLETAGLEFLDAPVLGGTVGVQKAALSIMIGGKAGVLARVHPLLRLLDTTIVHAGSYGAGQVAKACNQIVQVISIRGIVEAMLFARAQDANPPRVLAAIGSGFAGSRMFDLEGSKMAERNFAVGAKARLYDKDFSLVREIAQGLGLQIPAMKLVASQLNTLIANGWGYDDTALLLRVLEQQDNHHTD